LDKEFS
jgi:hypothetical protein